VYFKIMQNLFEDEEARIKPRRNQQRPDIDKFQSMLHQVMGGKQPVQETFMDIDESNVERIGAPVDADEEPIRIGSPSILEEFWSRISNAGVVPSNKDGKPTDSNKQIAAISSKLGSYGNTMILMGEYASNLVTTFDMGKKHNAESEPFILLSDKFMQVNELSKMPIILLGSVSSVTIQGEAVVLFHYPKICKTLAFGPLFLALLQNRKDPPDLAPKFYNQVTDSIDTTLAGAYVGKFPIAHRSGSLLLDYAFQPETSMLLFNPLSVLFRDPESFNVVHLVSGLMTETCNLGLLLNLIVSHHEREKVKAVVATDGYDIVADTFRNFRKQTHMMVQNQKGFSISLDHADVSSWYANATTSDFARFLSIRVQTLTDSITSLFKLDEFKAIGASDLSIYMTGTNSTSPEDIQHVRNLDVIKDTFSRSLSSLLDSITTAASGTSESLLRTMGDLNLKLQAAYAKNATLSAEISRNRKALYKMEKQGGGSNPRSGSMNNLSEEDARKEKRATESLWRTHVTLAVHNDFRKYHFVRFTRMVAGFQGQNNEFRLLNVDISDSIIEKIVSELKFGKGKDTSLIGGEAQATLVSLRSRLEDMIKSEKEPYAPYLNLDDEDSSECVYLQATNVLRDGMMQALNYVRDCQLESDENALLLDMKYFTTIEEKERDPTKVKLQSIFAEMVSAIITVIDETQKKVTTTAKQHVYRTEYLSRIKLEMRAALIRAGYDIKPNTYAPSKRHQVYF